MLRRVIRSARAHAGHTHQTVVERLTEGLALTAPDAHSADSESIQSYLAAIGRTVIATRYACNNLLDQNGNPYQASQPNGFICGTLISPGCEAAMSLLDAVDNHFTNLLVNWGRDFWCRPRDLYDRLRQHEIEYESGLARFTGFLEPVETIAPAKWPCDD